MFQTLRPRDEVEGSGIGLGWTLVKAVVEMHGGSVEVFSEGLGRGSEFRVNLPLTRQTAQATISRTIVNQVQTIAIVEDIPDARVMLAGILRLKGYTVSEAGFDGHLVKPLDLDNLAELLDQGRSVEVEN